MALRSGVGNRSYLSCGYGSMNRDCVKVLCIPFLLAGARSANIGLGAVDMCEGGFDRRGC